MNPDQLFNSGIIFFSVFIVLVCVYVVYDEYHKEKLILDYDLEHEEIDQEEYDAKLKKQKKIRNWMLVVLPVLGTLMVTFTVAFVFLFFFFVMFLPCAKSSKWGGFGRKPWNP